MRAGVLLRRAGTKGKATPLVRATGGLAATHLNTPPCTLYS